MKIKKLLFSGALLGLSGLILGACGNSGGNANNDNGKKEITFMFRGGEDEKKAYETAIKQFEEANDVSVKIIATDADQYATKLQAAISGGNMPDVFYVEQGNLMAYVDNGVLLDITDQIENSDFDLSNI